MKKQQQKRQQLSANLFDQPNRTLSFIEMSGKVVRTLAATTQEHTKRLHKKFGPNILSVLKNYDIYEILGRGSYGVVVKMCKQGTNQCFAAKISKTNRREFELEYIIQEKVYFETGLTLRPAHRPVYFSDGNKTYGILLMELIYGDMMVLSDFLERKLSLTTLKYIFNQLIFLIDQMDKYKIIHGDMHFSNILIKDNTQLLLFDFGLASFGVSNRKLDFLQLIRTTFPKYNKNKPVLLYNLRVLRSFLLKAVYKEFRIAPKTHYLSEKFWDEEMTVYMKSDVFRRLRI